MIGASIGGVAALGAILPALPAGFRPAMAIVLHLPAEHDSLLAELFSGPCRLPVVEALDKMPIEPGHVYFAPPGYHLLIEQDEHFALSVDDPVNFSRPSIDVLFESAAVAIGPAVLGVVLTGSNADGADGLAAIRRAGGLAWVQLPETAQAAPMPLAAIERAGADRILSLDAIALGMAELRDGTGAGP